MKNILKTLSIATVLLSATGCDDFLTLSSQDQIIPSTVAHYKEVLQGDGYFQKLQENIAWTEFLTDNMSVGDYGDAGLPGYTSALIPQYEPLYKWQAEIENDKFSDKLYAYLYAQILPATICLEQGEKAKGTEEEHRILRGQASFQRAMALFYLANFYAPAYNESQPDDLCIPMTKTATPTPGSYPRKTMAEVWGQISDDCQTAITSLARTNINNVFEINYRAALLLAARVALFMEDYDAAIRYGEQFLEEHASLYDMTTLDLAKWKDPETNQDYEYDAHMLNTNLNPEIVFSFGGDWKGLNSYIEDYTTTSLAFCLSTSESDGLIPMYAEKDVRGAFYFYLPDPNDFWLSLGYTSNANYGVRKWSRYKPCTGCMMGLRSAEVYLILAEAEARKAAPDKGKALFYLNALLSKRIQEYTPLSVSDFTTDAALVERIWAESRKELCFEEAHRWWDMRRTGQKGFTRTWIGGEKYVIADHDPSFTLNFPIKERQFDPGLVPNPRPDRSSSK